MADDERRTGPDSHRLDVFVALIAILLLWPVLLVLAAIVRLDSRGPSTYCEERLGRDGKPFRIYKFRTLHQEAAVDPPVAASGDSRITRLGTWIRPIHLDELPQLFNIVRGDMRFVGPRPTRAELWASVDDDLRQRALAFTPGLTSPASIRFNCEDDVLAETVDPVRAYRDIVFPAKVAMDVRHFENRRRRGNLEVIIATARTVLGRRDERNCRRRIERLLSGEKFQVSCSSTKSS